MKFKLRELSPIIVSVFILSIAIIGITSAAITNNGSIGGLFFAYPGESGYNWNSQTTTTGAYKLDGRNIYPTFGSDKTIKAGSGVFSNKVTSASTNNTDSSSTLTTKDYVENFANNAASGAKDNLGNHIATQDLNMSGSKIINLATPINANDATNKAYVDSRGDNLGNHIATQDLNMSGNNISNVKNIFINNNITSSGIIRNKTFYAYPNIGEGIYINGGINVSLHRIVNVGTPILSNDAATKAYVDSKVGGGSTALNLVNGFHSSTQCTTLGGIPVNIPGGKKLCKFAGATCKGPFLQYLNWSTTRPSGASSLSHVFSNTPVESARRGGMRWGRSSRRYTYTTTYSIVTEIGCY